jgi:hypothetical protein
MGLFLPSGPPIKLVLQEPAFDFSVVEGDPPRRPESHLLPQDGVSREDVPPITAAALLEKITDLAIEAL